jgi:N-acetylglucosaminyldiphosphoundecaprenol N-acetyl-beta-D-mannosaminyltransferase
MVASIGDAILAGATARTVVAVNAHTYTEAQKDPGFKRVVNDAFIGWPDGVPITWAASLLGSPLGPRIHGHDLMSRLLREPFSHFFYGSSPLVLSEMARRLPGVRIAGMEAPPFAREAVPSDVSRINASRADILWVALGAPKQELWAQLNRNRLRVPVVACVGAAFEILAGRFSRAPGILQRAGLEWAWRLGQNPARLWRRYLSTNGYFATFVLRKWLAS